MIKLKSKFNVRRDTAVKLMGLVFVIAAGDVSALTIGGMADAITSSFGQVTKLVTAAAYLGGMGFAVGSIIKFKAHKDNPAQVPVGQPIGLLFVAAALIFLPSILSVAGETIFGSAGSVGGPTGTVFTTS